MVSRSRVSRAFVEPRVTQVTQRLFLALWPDEAVRAQLDALCQRLPLSGGRLVAPANLHATLVFLGNVDAARRGCIERALDALRAPAFEIVLAELVWRRRGGMLWAAAAEIPAALHDLLAALNAALGSCGYQPEPRPYRLHVTLARNVRRAPRDKAIAPIRWRANEFCLVSSAVTSAGSAYTVERRWPLA